MPLKKEEIDVHLIDSISFNKYGQVIRIPDVEEKKPDFESEIINFYGALGVFDSTLPIEFGICTFKKREFVVVQLEQHLHTQELLYAVDDDFIMPVATNIFKGSKNHPDLENLRAVKLRRGEGVIFNKGTWHCVPYPFKEESFALVGFAKDTAKNDLEICNLDEKIRIIENKKIR